MFTGLVEAVGRVDWVRRGASGVRIRISAPFASELEQGESVSVNGVCQTVVRADRSAFEVDAVAQTLSITTLGTMRGGAYVNLERALRAGDRMGGHFVTGHADGVARVTEMKRGRDGVRLSVEIPGELVRYVVERGSIALDGVSLTVAETDGARVTVALIPETLRATVAAGYRSGTRVNIETDVMAKQQEKLLLRSPDASRDQDGARKVLTVERLKELGFTE
jgi:riboflavin synthase